MCYTRNIGRFISKYFVTLGEIGSKSVDAVTVIKDESSRINEKQKENNKKKNLKLSKNAEGESVNTTATSEKVATTNNVMGADNVSLSDATLQEVGFNVEDSLPEKCDSGEHKAPYTQSIQKDEQRRMIQVRLWAQ